MARFPAAAGTTRVLLWRALAGLELALIVVLAGSVWVFQGTRATAQRVEGHSVPSIVHIMAARAALVEADAAAVGSFRTGAVGLTGPGERYQNQIAVAGQSLTQLAADSIAGPGVSQTIQLVEGLLTAYAGLIEQADAHYRQDPASVLAVADLSYASRLLHMPDGGILAQLDGLLDTESRALAGQLTSGRMAPGWVLTWIVPAVVLLALLLATQVFLSRRFRRTFNLPLVGATLATLALAAGMSADFAARGEMTATREAGAALVGVWRAGIDATDRRGQETLHRLVARTCGAGCADTAAAPGAEAPTARIRDLAGHASAAAGTGTAQLLVVLAALAAMALVPLGLFPRLEEYR